MVWMQWAQDIDGILNNVVVMVSSLVGISIPPSAAVMMRRKESPHDRLAA
jgi:hypothetical protein